MKLRFRPSAAALCAALVAVSLVQGQRGGSNPPPLPPAEGQEEPRLPNGKVQRDEILKAEYQQNLKDATLLVQMAEELKQDLEKNDRFVLSLSTLKKTDDIEKLVKKIRSRMRHN